MKGFASLLGRIFGPALALAVLLGAAVSLQAAESAEAYSSKLRRYPYLTDVVGSSATVNWATDKSSAIGTVKWGEVADGSCTASSKPATRRSIVVGSVSHYQWRARISVKPDTEYCYRVYLGASPQEDLLGGDSSPRFLTQLPAGSPEPFSFVVFGDWGEVDASGQNPDQANVISQIAQSGARFALTTGDNTHPNSGQVDYGDLVPVAAKRNAVFGPNFWKVAGASMPIFPALGNHGFGTPSSHLTNWPQDEAVSESGGTYDAETYCCQNGTKSGSYGSAWYAFDAGNARFYVLEAAWSDSNLGSATAYESDYDYHWTPTSAQYQWLKNDLETHSSQLKFAFFHYPMYADNKGTPSDTFLRGAGSLEGLLSRHGVDLGFSGHAHIYQRNLKAHADSLVTYVSGGGGARPGPVGDAGCSPTNAYGIGWSVSANRGYACGSAARPTSKNQAFHFLKVSVDGTRVTVTPTDSLGRSFDETTYEFGRSADLSIARSDLPDPVPVRETLTYTAAVRNDGPDPATGVTFTDKLPTGSSFQSATPSQGTCSQSLGTVTCSLDGLASGATATVEIKIEPQREGTITAGASAHANEFDPDTSDNSAVEETTVEQPDGVFAFIPTDDAYVRSDATTSNYGARTTAEIDGSPAKHALMRFAVSGIGSANVINAKLRLYCLGGSTKSGGQFYGAMDNGWSESTVTWDTAPPFQSALLGSIAGVSPGNWYEVDVTSLVSGDGVYNLRVSSTSSDGAEYSSKEDPFGLVPQLIVSTG